MFRQYSVLKAAAVFGLALAASGCGDSESSDVSFLLPAEPAAPRSEAVLALTESDGAPLLVDAKFFSTDEDRAGTAVIDIPAGGVINIPLSQTALTKLGAGQPVSIVGRVVAEGYLDTIVTIELDSVGGISGTEIVALIKLDPANEIVGVEVQQMTADATAGPITLTVNEDDAGAALIERSVVSVKQLSASDLGSGADAISGVDENGNEVMLTEADLSSLVVEVAHFDASSEAALEAFPGGLAASIRPPSSSDYGDDEPAATRDNNDEAAIATDGDVVFQSAGFVAINVRATRPNGDAIDIMDLGPNKIVKVRMNIPAATINPETDAAVAVGDTVPVWGINPRDQQWRYEGRASVQQDATGLFVEYEPTHLSYFNLDWYGRRCNASFTLVDGADSAGAAVDFEYYVNLRNSGFSRTRGPNRASQRLTLSRMPNFSRGLSFQFRTSYSSGPIEVTNVRRANSSTAVNFTLDNGTIRNFNPCSGPNRDYIVTVRRPADLPETIRFNMQATAETFCQQNPSIRNRYSGTYAYAYIRPNGRSYRYQGSRRTDQNGIANWGSRTATSNDRVTMYMLDRNRLPGQPYYQIRTVDVPSAGGTLNVNFAFPRDCPAASTGATGSSGGSGF